MKQWSRKDEEHDIATDYTLSVKYTESLSYTIKSIEMWTAPPSIHASIHDVTKKTRQLKMKKQTRSLLAIWQASQLSMQMHACSFS